MKNVFLGLASLSAIVGVGSGGVFFAHRMLGAKAAAEAPSDPAEPTRDMSPKPIPLASDDSPAPTPNPFQSPSQTAASDDIPNADQVGLASGAAQGGVEPESRYGNTDGGSADPFARRRPAMPEEPRYPTRRTSAEVPVDDTAADRYASDAQPADDEPRQLEPSPTDRQIDRFGDTGTRQQSGDDIPPAEQPADDPSNGGTQEPEPLAADDSAADSGEGTGVPGDPQLSGSQAPTLTIEKLAPAEIQIGKPAKFIIKVRNAGSVAAQGVEIHDTIPQGTQLIDTAPQAARGQRGALVWELGTLKPADERKVEVDLMPTAEGEIGSVATVHFRAEASVRTVSTKPMLTLDVTGPERVMKGDKVVLKIHLSNPGSGAASGIIISENVPEGLSHPDGKELEFELGVLKPGESRELDLALTAAAAGVVTNVISARGDASLTAEAQTEIEVVAPQLQVSMAGPKRRYLERNATHTISVSNPGTASAKDVDLMAVLPRQLKFVEANNGGQFDAATHAVYWSLEELPPQETGTVTLTTLPVEPGDAKLLIKSKARQGLLDEREEVVAVEGLAAINFQLSDASDPIEAGGQTTYEVRVSNTGSKSASNVRLVALVPREMKPLSAEGPARYKIEGQRVVFDALKQLAPKTDASFKFKVQAVEPGDLRVQVQVSSDEIRDPVTKEENTRVFGDE